MELDNLKGQWKALDAKLDKSIRLNTLALRSTALKKAKTPLRILSLGLWMEIIVSVPLLLLLGSFVAGHYSQPQFLIPGMLLHVAVILFMGAAIRQLVAISQLDYSGPIVRIQRQIASLHRRRMWANLLAFLAAPVLWAPFLIVVLKGLFNVNTYALFRGDWLFANVLLGVIVGAGAVFVAWRYGDRMKEHSVVRAIMQDLGGHSLNKATAVLRSLEDFEKEQTV